MSETETTLRDDLEAAVAEFESEELPSGPQAAQASETPPQEPAEDETSVSTPPAEDPGAPSADADLAGESGTRRRDERGRFLADESHPTDSEHYPNLTAERVNAAPEGWRPAAREGWAELPEGVRREIHRRELDIATGLESSKAARDLSTRFSETVTPFASVMAAEGLNDPMDAVKGLLGTAAALRMGTTEQKAERLVGLIKHYGIDVDALDAALATSIRSGGAQPPAGPENPLTGRLEALEQRLAGINGQIEQAAARRGESADAEVARFAAEAEFLPDVRLDMADLMDVATKRGRQMSMQEAYDAACNMNPEIKAVLARRNAETRTAAGQQTVAAKRALASSSLAAPQTGVAPAANGAGSLRDDLMAAWDAQLDR